MLGLALGVPLRKIPQSFNHLQVTPQTLDPCCRLKLLAKLQEAEPLPERSHMASCMLCFGRTTPETYHIRGSNKSQRAELESLRCFQSGKTKAKANQEVSLQQTYR